MITLLEKRILFNDLKKFFDSSERRILGFMSESDLKLLKEYISLFDEVTKLELELDSSLKFKKTSNMYVPTLKSIIDSYNDWKLIYALDVFDDGSQNSNINFDKVLNNLKKKHSNKLLSKKLELKIQMWEKEKTLATSIDNATKKMFLNMGLKSIVASNRLKVKK